MDLADRIKRWRGEDCGEEIDEHVDLLVEAEEYIRDLERRLGAANEQTLDWSVKHAGEVFRANAAEERAGTARGLLARAAEVFADVRQFACTEESCDSCRTAGEVAREIVALLAAPTAGPEHHCYEYDLGDGATARVRCSEDFSDEAAAALGELMRAAYKKLAAEAIESKPVAWGDEDDGSDYG